MTWLANTIIETIVLATQLEFDSTKTYLEIFMSKPDFKSIQRMKIATMFDVETLEELSKCIKTVTQVSIIIQN